jgi:hypothetical protein
MQIITMYKCICNNTIVHCNDLHAQLLQLVLNPITVTWALKD